MWIIATLAILTHNCPKQNTVPKESGCTHSSDQEMMIVRSDFCWRWWSREWYSCATEQLLWEDPMVDTHHHHHLSYDGSDCQGNLLPPPTCNPYSFVTCLHFMYSSMMVLLLPQYLHNRAEQSRALCTRWG
jgi:hypothetical protein